MDNKLKEAFLSTLEGYEKQYAEIHEKCIPRVWSGVKEEDREKVYRQALEQGKTWEEIVHYHSPGDDAIL